MQAKWDSFYVITQPGFEDELVEELSEFWGLLVLTDGSRNSSPLNILSKDIGGVLIQCELVLGLQINFFSKLASRVLLRVFEKKLEKMAQLETWIKSFQLQEKLNSKKFQFKIQAHNSFHWNEKRYLHHLDQSQLLSNSDDDATIYLRISDNRLTLSIDTTGDHLHKRGYRIFDNQASIRETVASFCLRKLTERYGLACNSKLTILDPMCGSGTFLFEAQGLFLPNFKRKFSFLNFSMTPKILKSETFSKNFHMSDKIFKDCIGFDIDSKSIEASIKNLEKLETSQDTKVSTNDVYKFQTMDFFSLSLDNDKAKKTLIIFNPPYGVRKEKIFSAFQVVNKMKSLQAANNGIIWPKSETKEIETALKENSFKHKVYNFKNGGIEVGFYIFSNS